jgi:hypothetical protein
MDQALVLQADALQVGPHARLNVFHRAVDGRDEIGVLVLHRVTEIGFHHDAAMLKARLKIGHGAEILDFIG